MIGLYGLVEFGGGIAHLKVLMGIDGQIGGKHFAPISAMHPKIIKGLLDFYCFFIV